jgi:signal transduction histidine kinase
MIEGTEEPLFVSTVEEVTDQREAEAALADSESRFRQLYEQAPIAIQREDHSSVIEEFARLRTEGITDIRKYLKDSDQITREILARVKIIDANPAARELQGHLEQSEGQLTLLDRYTDPSVDTFVETLAAIWEGKTSLDQFVETIAPDGSARFLDLRWHVPLIDGEPDYSRVMVTIADITELREAQRRLEDLIESKDRFLASVAHELRTPLTAVVGFAQELKDELHLYGESEKEEFRELIAFHSAELSHVIEDLLVWARGDVGEVRVYPERIDLADAVRRSVNATPGLELEITEPEGKVEALADPARLRQIVRNLTTNAMRYGGSKVSVQVRRVDGEACLEVMDNGPRMDSADMNRIFEPYTRSDAVTAAPGSIGLGLTVSRTLARLQDGDVVCVREGDYNVFRVTLPLAPERMLTDTSV